MMFGCLDFAWLAKDVSRSNRVKIRMGLRFWMDPVNVILSDTARRQTARVAQIHDQGMYADPAKGDDSGTATIL